MLNIEDWLEIYPEVFYTYGLDSENGGLYQKLKYKGSVAYLCVANDGWQIEWPCMVITHLFHDKDFEACLESWKEFVDEFLGE